MRMHRLMLASILLLAPVAQSSGQDLVERATFAGHTLRADWTALSPDGKIMASGGRHSQGGELKLWDTGTGKEIASLAGYSSSLDSLAFSADGKRLTSGGYDGVRVWDVSTHRELVTFKALYGHANLVAFSPDGQKLAAVGGRQVQFWDIASGKELSSFQHQVGFYGGPGLTFSRDLTTLAARNYQEIDLWDVATGKQRATLSEHRGEVGCLAYSLDGKTLVAASTRYYGRNFKWEGDVKLWDVATGKERTAFKGPFGRVWAAALSPDSKTLALLDFPELHAVPDLKLLEVATGRQRIIRNPPAHAFTSLAFTTDGRLFVTGTPDDKIVKLWEVSLLNKEGK